ncbi:MAG: ATP-grasp domain-containing protein, partial [Gaiellaceae bacterium]
MAGIVAILGNAGPVHEWLAEAWRDLGLTAVVVRPQDVELLDGGDVLVGRLDVLPTLDGIEPGLRALGVARARGVRVVNGPSPLLRAHDKLLTAEVLLRAGLPHPRTECVPAGGTPTLEPPVVVKPRYGSWGRDVVRCDSAEELAAHLESLAGVGWFRRHGALVQDLVPAPRHDLRILVADGRVVGAAERQAAPGEWRTNMSLGGSLRRARPGSDACELALAAAEIVGCEFVGVDLLPGPDGWVALELNAAVD